MVLEDIFTPEQPTNLKPAARPLEELLAAPIDRLAANVADLILFVPFVTLVVAPFSRRAKEAQLIGNESGWATAVFAAGGAAFLALVLYQTIFVVLWGATPGKIALRLRIVSIWRGAESKPTAFEAFLRAVVGGLEVCLLGIPWLAIFSNGMRRPFHDRIGDTAVIALTSRRRAGPPTLAEMSVASGFQSASLAVFALVCAVNLSQLTSHEDSTKNMASQRESDGLLCAEVREAIEETPGRKAGSIEDRLKTALALYGVGAIDKDCLSGEAEFALWRNTERGLAYLAKGLASKPGGEAYFEKACATNDREVCAMVELSRSEVEVDADQDVIEAKATEAARDQDLTAIVASIDARSSDYLRVRGVSYLMQARDYKRALELMERGTGSQRVAGFLAKERAKALWSVDRTEEAHVAMSSSVGLVDASTRVDLARWFCYQDAATEGCSERTRSSCAILNEAVDRFDGWLMKPEIATAYIRAQICLDTDWSALEKKIPASEGKALVRALAKGTEGQMLLRAVVETNGEDRGAYFLEASTRLVELAKTLEDLTDVEAQWLKLESRDEAWKPLGLSLLRKMTDLKAWDAALTLGLKIAKADPADRRAYETLAVAAHGAGQKKVALGFLETALRLSTPAMTRAPASEPRFEQTARQLLKGGGK